MTIEIRRAEGEVGMEAMDEMIGMERRRGMEKVWGTRKPYQGEVKVEVEREEWRRSPWIECRECQRRERVRSMNRSELIRVVDAGEIRCTECGGRMVEV